MRPTQGYDQATAMDGSGYPTLPPGGYVCEIKGAREDTTKNGGQMIVVAFDIAEGEHKGFFTRQHNADRARSMDSKWRGTFYQPTTNREGATNGFFKGLITAIERSNIGYKWDWDEGKLKGKKIGFVFGEEEYLNRSGEVRISVKPVWPRDVEAIRAGVEAPEIKRLARDAHPTIGNTQAGFTQVDDDELPF